MAAVSGGGADAIFVDDGTMGSSDRGTTRIESAQRIDCEYLVDVCLEAYLHMAVYSATKAGLIAFTRTIGGEVGPIRVNAICPGDPCAFGPQAARAP